jgi:long-subunit fatty acid transport protein
MRSIATALTTFLLLNCSIANAASFACEKASTSEDERSASTAAAREVDVDFANRRFAYLKLLRKNSMTVSHVGVCGVGF